MDLYHKLLAGFAVVLLLAGVLGAFEYVSIREEKARIEERQKADAALMAVKDAALKTQGEQLKQAAEAFEGFKRDQVAATQAMELRFTQATSAQQIASLTDKLLGLKPGEAKAGGTQENPTIELPAAQQKEYERACEECKLKLTGATESLKLAAQRQAFLDTKSADDDDKIKRLTKERDDANKLGAGGSTWTRVKHDTKAGFFGAAIEAVLLALSGHLK